MMRPNRWYQFTTAALILHAVKKVPVGPYLLTAFLCCLPTLSLAAATPDSTTTVAGPGYAAGGTHQFFLGSGYRTVWTTPFRAPYLDLEREAGGLTITGTGGGMQTKGLRFVGADGRPYSFRSLDKDPSEVLPAEFMDTTVKALVQDQTSAALPTAPPVVAALLDALGILHVQTRILVIPDDPVLGENRPVFADLPGTFEEWPNEGPEHTPGFAGATEIVSSEELFETLDADPSQRIAVHEFLMCRLFDVWIGDWDRHRGQWRWASVGQGTPPAWRPIPEDRDQAFARYGGLFISLARPNFPQLTEFKEDYPAVLGASWNGRDLDRRFLVGLAWAEWDSVSQVMQGILTDTVIAAAVRRLPPEHHALIGEQTAAILRHRRDHLPGMARDYYQLLAGEVDVRCTHRSEEVQVTRHENGDLDLTIRSADADPFAKPFMQRRFFAAETKEVRIYLLGGDDRVQIDGEGKGDITLRVISGAGEDRAVDHSLASRTRYYDERTTAGLAVDGAEVDQRPYRRPPFAGTVPPRDWGHYNTWYAYPSLSKDYDFMLKTTWYLRRLGFRSDPFMYEHRIGLDVASRQPAFRLEYEHTRYPVTSSNFWHLRTMGSGLEVVNFYGFGNDTPRPDSKEFFSTNQTVYLVALRKAVLSKHRPYRGRYPTRFLAPGLGVEYQKTDLDEETLVSAARPYGAQDFGQLVAFIDAVLDTRDDDDHPQRGWWFQARGKYAPGIWGVTEGAYGWLAGAVSTYWTPVRPATLALRLGGKKIWGTFPYQESAFLGGSSTVRGYDRGRFAGDASIHGNAEIRLRLLESRWLLPSQSGIFLLGDMGRVFVDGESAGGWHTGAGFGLWVGLAGLSNTLSGSIAWSDEGAGFYFDIGFEF